MTKKLRPFLAILSFSVSSLCAAQVGNPADPALLEEGFWISDTRFSSLRAGISGDVLLSKRLRTCRMSSGRGISRPELSWTLAYADLGWNIRERFDLHLLGGPVGSAALTWQQTGSLYKAKGDSALFCGASAKLILLEIEDTTLGVDGLLGALFNVEGPLLMNETPLASSFTGRLEFWQVGVGLSQHIGVFRPYLGSAVNQLKYKIRSSGIKTLRFHDLLQVGMYEGCTFTLGTRAFLNLEARQLFETGVSLSGELRF